MGLILRLISDLFGKFQIDNVSLETRIFNAELSLRKATEKKLTQSFIHFFFYSSFLVWQILYLF